jgi:5-methylcytosine-specific restriction endonuclease McrA
MSFQVGKYTFSSAAACEAHTRAWLDQALGKFNRVRITPGKSPSFLMALLERHPHKAEKIGSGVQYFVLERSPGNRGVRTFAVRAEGAVDFSWKICCAGKDPGAGRKLTMALRYAVRGQINDWIEEQKPTHCKSCETMFRTRLDWHVDHVVPFKLLSAEFLHGRKAPTEFTDLEISGGHKFSMADWEFERDWLAFHKDKATLQALCVECNQKKRDRHE